MTESTKKYAYEPPSITYNTRLIKPVTTAPKLTFSAHIPQRDVKRQREIVIKLIQFIKSL